MYHGDQNPLLQYLEGEGTRLEERVKTRVKLSFSALKSRDLSLTKLPLVLPLLWVSPSVKILQKVCA
ncbi:hypothetical protein, partial [Flectobacillus sp. BAB-3569]|uniref:hypothetical protein n=1 Tax=Flectobacillus sp. BAB-3569 TaxID=1509483 RepID=UPI001C3D5DC0